MHIDFFFFLATFEIHCHSIKFTEFKSMVLWVWEMYTIMQTPPKSEEFHVLLTVNLFFQLWPKATTDLLFVPKIVSSLEFHTNGIICWLLCLVCFTLHIFEFHPCFLHVSVVHSMVLPSSVSLSGYTTTCSPIYYLMNILIVSSLGQLSIMLLWTFVYSIFVCRYMYSFLVI